MANTSYAQGHVIDLYNYRTSDKWHMIDLK